MLFWITEFRFLKRLILVHGRYSYNRTAFLSQYSFYKSLLICFIQILWVPLYCFFLCWFSLTKSGCYVCFWYTDIRPNSASLLFQVSLELVFSNLLAWWLIMSSILVFLFWSVSLTKILVNRLWCSILKFYSTARQEGKLFPIFFYSLYRFFWGV